MIRQGWVITAKDKWYSPIENIIYMSKEAAEEAKQKYITNKECLEEKLCIESYEVIEDNQSIDDFYNQIEQEDPAYQAALTEAINKIENPTFSNNLYVDSTGRVTDFKKYLKDIFDEAADKNWLSTISICGGDY